MSPPPSYNVPLTLLVVGTGLAAFETYIVVTSARFHLPVLFVAPGAILLGTIGLCDPAIPCSLLPNAQGYPSYKKWIANGCWAASVVIGSALYFLLR